MKSILFNYKCGEILPKISKEKGMVYSGQLCNTDSIFFPFILFFSLQFKKIAFPNNMNVNFMTSN